MQQYKSAQRDGALELAKAGFHVFPCHYMDGDKCSCGKADCFRPGKHPANGKGGCLDATTEEDRIHAFWFSKMKCNVAIATGHPWPRASGEHRHLAVVDIDVAGGKCGQQSCDKLTEQHGPLPETLRARTRSGGMHYYFLTRRPVKNVKADNEGKASTYPLGLHIDVRGKGGYVLAPPSNHRSGRPYEWENWGTPIAPMPDWMEALLTGAETQVPAVTPGAVPIDLPHEFKQDDLTIELSDDELQDALDAIPVEEIDEYDPGTAQPGGWWQVGAALKTIRGDAAFPLWKAWSQRAPKFKTKYSITAKALSQWESDLERFWRDFKPGHFFAETILFFARKNKKYKLPDRIAKARDEADGRKTKAAIEHVEKLGWVFCVGAQEFYSEEPFQRFSKNQFSDMYAYLRVKQKTFADQCLSDPSFPRVHAYTFDPRTTERFIKEDGLDKLNLYRPNIIIAQPGAVKRFTDHAAYILPDEKQCHILLQVMAFHIKHPGEKIRWVLVLHGTKQRTGKSFFGQVQRKLLGKHNVRIVSNERLHEPWTDWQEHAQLVIVEELKGIGSRMEILNKLKPMITEDTTNVRLPGGRSYEMPNRYNCMMFTNHKDALPLDVTDRRYCILSSPAGRMPDEYYAGPWQGSPLGLWDWTDNNIPQIYDYLRTYRLEGFNANGEAPETEALKEVVERQLSDLDEWVQSLFENKAGLFAFDLVVIEHLLMAMPDHLLKKGYGRNSMAKAIEKMGGLQHPRRAQLGRSGYSRIWVVRNHDSWAGQSEGVLGRAYVQFVGGAAGVTDLNRESSPERLKDAVNKTKTKNPQTALHAAVKEVGKGPM